MLEQFNRRPGGEEEPYELKLSTKAGVSRWIRISPHTLKDSKGNFKGVLAVFSDVTTLKDAENELQEKTRSLEEANVALKVTLRKCDEERMDLEHKVQANVNELILPYLEKAMTQATRTPLKSYLSILESNLNHIISPFSANLTNSYSALTPREIQVADMIRHGRTTKEIADLLGISTKTVEIHRGNIRRKMGIRKTGQNLRSYLLSLA